jgi:hypothetical protein
VVVESDATNLAVVESDAHRVLLGEQVDLAQSAHSELLEQSAQCALPALVVQRVELVLVATVEFVEPVDSKQY